MSIKNLYEKSFKPITIDPQKSDHFLVEFYHKEYDKMVGETLVPLTLEENMDLAIKTSLPGYDIKTVTRKYLGGKYTDIVGISYEGTTTFDFYYKIGTNLSNFIPDTKYFIPYFTEKTKFPEITISLIPNTIKENGTATLHKYTLYNCIITKLSLPEMNYENQDVMKYSIEVHYDYWNLDGEGII